MLYIISSVHHQALHSFPTRRSSDLAAQSLRPSAIRVIAQALSPDDAAMDIGSARGGPPPAVRDDFTFELNTAAVRDRKSTRLNSSHTVISYAVFCLKKKKNTKLIMP